MYLYSQSSLDDICRHLASHIVAGMLNVGRRTLHHQDSLSIVATRGANSIHESLIVLYQVVGCCLIFGIGLIQSGEEQMFVVVLEGIGNLSPQGRQYLLVLFDSGSI